MGEAGGRLLELARILTFLANQSGTSRWLRRSIFANRGWSAVFKRASTRGADGFVQHEPDRAFTPLTDCLDASALNVLKECLFLWSVDVPEAEIVLIDGGHWRFLPVIGLEETKGAQRSNIIEMLVTDFNETSQYVSGGKQFVIFPQPPHVFLRMLFLYLYLFQKGAPASQQAIVRSLYFHYHRASRPAAVLFAQAPNSLFRPILRPPIDEAMQSPAVLPFPAAAPNGC
jgi:hypothetical protein